MLLQPKAGRRAGATTVEFAFVAALLFLMLFGILEYGRFLFVYHLTTNAARDAARFAVVRTSGGVTLTEADGTQIAEPASVSTAEVVGGWGGGDVQRAGVRDGHVRDGEQHHRVRGGRVRRPG